MLRWLADVRAERTWNGGLPVPMRRKRATIRAYRRAHSLRVLVETGTYLGDTAAALRSEFDQVLTIELEPTLASWATKRFEHDPRVRVLAGDSATLLPRILADLRQPALFWLDGHYSGPGTGYGDGPTPIVSELASIATHPVQGHVVLIDDARCFGQESGYPSLEEIAALAQQRPAWRMSVADDIIRLAPVI